MHLDLYLLCAPNGKRGVALRFISIVCPNGKEEWLLDVPLMEEEWLLDLYLLCAPNGEVQLHLDLYLLCAPNGTEEWLLDLYLYVPLMEKRSAYCVPNGRGVALRFISIVCP